jgi:hypothetical protein
MARQRKQTSESARRKPARSPAPAEPAKAQVHPPLRRPVLLVVSIALFALWFAFLLLTALSGRE